MKMFTTAKKVVLIASTLGLLAACGTPAAPTTDAGSAAPAANTSVAPTAGAKTKVTVMTWEGADTNAAIDAALATFEQNNPDIDVERLESPNSGYGDKLNSMAQAKQLPDIFWAGNDTAQQFGAQGLLYDWSEKAKAANTDAFKLDQFAPGAIENWTGADGKLYGLPTLMNTYGVWYNEDLLKAANVSLPKPGWTYEEMFKAAEALTVKDGSNVTRYGLYAEGRPNEGFLSPFTVSNCAVSAGGQPFMDKVINPTKVTADDKFVACAKMFADAVQAGSVTPPGYPGDGLTESFIAGQVPMLFFGQWLAPSFIQAKPNFKIGFAPLPVMQENVQPYDAVGIASPATIQNPDAVWKVSQFLASDAWKTVLVGAPVAPAAHVESSTPYFDTLTKDGLTSVPEAVRYELDAQNKQGIRFTAPWATQGNDIISASWGDVLQGKKPLESTIATMVEQINSVISAN